MRIVIRTASAVWEVSTADDFGDSGANAGAAVLKAIDEKDPIQCRLGGGAGRESLVTFNPAAVEWISVGD